MTCVEKDATRRLDQSRIAYRCDRGVDQDGCSRSVPSGIIVPALAALGVMGIADLDSEAMRADDERVALEFDRRRRGSGWV